MSDGTLVSYESATCAQMGLPKSSLWCELSMFLSSTFGMVAIGIGVILIGVTAIMMFRDHRYKYVARQ